jgi:RNA polymerase sigma factor (sigma-70 family)
MNDDAALLRRYVDDRREEAFAELVRRHVDQVYATALRRTGGDTHRAEDVAQQVFMELARHGRRLSDHPALGAWLYTSTRNAAINLMVAEQRRRHREQEACVMNELKATSAPDLDWERLRPVLDQAMDQLGEADRTAVFLRFFGKRSFGDVGRALCLTEDAARKRVERALDIFMALGLSAEQIEKFKGLKTARYQDVIDLNAARALHGITSFSDDYNKLQREWESRWIAKERELLGDLEPRYREFANT